MLVPVTLKRDVLVGTTAHEAGSVIEVDEDRAKALVENKAAVMGGIAEVADESPPENAEQKPAGKESRTKK